MWPRFGASWIATVSVNSVSFVCLFPRDTGLLRECKESSLLKLVGWMAGSGRSGRSRGQSHYKLPGVSQPAQESRGFGSATQYVHVVYTQN